MEQAQRNQLPLKTQYRIAAWFLVAVSALLILLLFESMQNIPLLCATREDFPRKEYTFISMKTNEDPDSGTRSYLISVEEEELPLRISDFMDSAQLRTRLESLEAGDSFYCYIHEDSASLEIVEMGIYTYVDFYTWEEYRGELAESVAAFSILGGVLLILAVVFSVRFFLKARKCGRAYL